MNFSVHDPTTPGSRGTMPDAMHPAIVPTGRHSCGLEGLPVLLRFFPHLLITQQLIRQLPNVAFRLRFAGQQRPF